MISISNNFLSMLCEGLLTYIYYRLWTWYIRTRFVMHQVLLNSWRVLTILISRWPLAAVAGATLSSGQFIPWFSSIHTSHTALLTTSYTPHMHSSIYSSIYYTAPYKLHTQLNNIYSYIHTSYTAPYKLSHLTHSSINFIDTDRKTT